MGWQEVANRLMYDGTAMAVPHKKGDCNRKLAARMVLLATAGKRASLEAIGTARFCRHFLAYDEARMIFWGRIAGRRITGWNGRVMAAEIVASYVGEAATETPPILDPAPDTELPSSTVAA